MVCEWHKIDEWDFRNNRFHFSLPFILWIVLLLFYFLLICYSRFSCVWFVAIFLSLLSILGLPIRLNNNWFNLTFARNFINKWRSCLPFHQEIPQTFRFINGNIFECSAEEVLQCFLSLVDEFLISVTKPFLWRKFR